MVNILLLARHITDHAPGPRDSDGCGQIVVKRMGLPESAMVPLGNVQLRLDEQGARLPDQASHRTVWTAAR